MPSPIGHALSGVAIAWTASLAEPRHHSGRTLSDRWLPIYMALAAAPDLDLLVHGAHRTATHSVTAMLLVTIVAGVVTGQVTRLRASRFARRRASSGSRVARRRASSRSRFARRRPSALARRTAVRAQLWVAPPARLARRRQLSATRHPVVVAVQSPVVHLRCRSLPADCAPGIFHRADYPAERDRRCAGVFDPAADPRADCLRSPAAAAAIKN
jgi:hypothetical protein